MSLGIKSIHSFFLLILISFNIQAADLVKYTPQSISADLSALAQLSNECKTAGVFQGKPPATLYNETVPNKPSFWNRVLNR